MSSKAPTRMSGRIPNLIGRDIMILSDAFPPFVAGGAEVSLQGALERLNPETRNRIVVCTFSDEVQQIEMHNHDGIAVFHCPSNAAWPYNTKLEPDFKRAREQFVFGPVWHDRIIRKRAEMLGPNSKRTKALFAHTRAQPRGGIIADEMINAKDVRVRFLTEVGIKMGRVAVLLADNTRSILLGAELSRIIGITSTVAVVRDNRFHCPRPQQNRIVRGKICKTCDYRCAEEDSKTDLAGRKENLHQTFLKRQEALQSYDKVIVTSHELKRHVAPLLRDDQEIARIPNTFGDVSKIQKKLASVAQPLNQKRIVIIGMLNENKGQLEFLKKSKQWLQRRKDVKIVLCGRGERIAKAIDKFCKENKLEGKVQLTGFKDRSALYEEIRKSHLVLAPTVWPEPFGRVPLEAGVARRAVVAFGVGGLNESIIHGVNGLLAPPKDYARLIELTEQVLDDGDLRVAMERNAYAHMINHYGPEKSSDVFCEFAFGEGCLATAASPV